MLIYYLMHQFVAGVIELEGKEVQTQQPDCNCCGKQTVIGDQYLCMDNDRVIVYVYCKACGFRNAPW